MQISGWLGVLVGLGALLYISKDSWKGHLKNWRGKIGI
jgi:hypothetical protein